MSGYRLKTGEMGKRVINTYKKVEDGVLEGYQTVEDAVVGSYKKEGLALLQDRIVIVHAPYSSQDSQPLFLLPVCGGASPDVGWSLVKKGRLLVSAQPAAR
ncbi:hypothetical protein AALB39_22320 [Lachnospiraceae bacterium 54-53]